MKVVTPDAQRKIAHRHALFQQATKRHSSLEARRANDHEYDDMIYAWNLDGALGRAKQIAGDPRYPQQVRNRYTARVKILEDAVAEERVKRTGIALWRNVGDMGFYAAFYGRLSSGVRINFGTVAGAGRHIGPFAEYMYGMFNPLSRGAGEIFEEALTEVATDITVSLSGEDGEQREELIGKAIELIIEQGPEAVSRRIYTKAQQKLESQKQTGQNLDPAQLDQDFEESELVKAAEELVEEKEREKEASDPEVKQSIERQSEELQGTNSLLIVLELLHQSAQKLRESLPDFKNFLEKVRQRYVDLHQAVSAAASPPTLEKYEEILEHRPKDLFDPAKSLGVDVIRADLNLLLATIDEANRPRLEKILEAIDGERQNRFLEAMTDFLGEHGGRIKGVILNGTSTGNPEYKGIFSDKDFTLIVDPDANLDAIRNTVRGAFEKHGVVLNAQGKPQSADIEVMIQTFLPGDVQQITTISDFLLWSRELTRDAATRHLSAGGAMWVGHYNYLNGGTLSQNGRAIVDPEPDPNFLPKPPLHPIFAHGLVLDMARFDILEEVSAIENASDLAEMLGKRAKYVLRAVDALIWAHANDLVNGRTPETARREGYHALVRADAEMLVQRGLLTQEEFRLVELLVDLKNGKSIYQTMGIAREDAEANRLRLEDVWNEMNRMMRRAYGETRAVHLKFLEEIANDASLDPELHELLFSIVFRDWNSIRQVQNRDIKKMRMLTGITDGDPLKTIKQQTQEIIGLGKELDNIPEGDPQDEGKTTNTALPGETPHDQSEHVTGPDQKTPHGQPGPPTPPASKLAELKKPFTEEELPEKKRKHITGDVTSVAVVKTAMSDDPYEQLNLLGEVVAFELARLLNANVPYTEAVNDENGNVKAAVLRFIESEQLDNVLDGEKKTYDENGSLVVVPVKVPQNRSREEFLADEKLRRQFIRLRILAAIIGDYDRHPRNYLVTKDGDLVGIDHYFAKPFDRNKDNNQLLLDEETVFEEMRKRFIGFDVTLNNNIDPGMRWVEQEMGLTRDEVLAELEALKALLNDDLLQVTRHYPEEFRERIEKTWRLRIKLLERLLESVAWPPLNLQFNEHAMDPAVFAAFVRYHQGKQGRSVRSLPLEGRSVDEIEMEISPEGWEPTSRPLKYKSRDGKWTKQVRPMTTPDGEIYHEVTYSHEDGGVVIMLPEGRPGATDEQLKNPHAWAYVQKDPQLGSSEGNEAFKLSNGEPVPGDKTWIAVPRELKGDEGRIADYIEKALARPTIVVLHSPRGPPDTPVRLGLGLKSRSRPEIDYIKWSKENEFQTYGALSEGVKGGFSKQIQTAMGKADEIHFNLEGVRIEDQEFYRKSGKAGELHDWGEPKSGYTNYELYLLYNNPEFRAKVKWHNGEDPFKNW